MLTNSGLKLLGSWLSPGLGLTRGSRRHPWQDTHELVHAVMVATEARTPTITKSFEVALAAGVATHKKISYTNPYVPLLSPLLALLVLRGSKESGAALRQLVARHTQRGV